MMHSCMSELALCTSAQSCISVVKTVTVAILYNGCLMMF